MNVLVERTAMLTRLLRLIGGLLVPLLLAGTAVAEKRVALVIGNSAYLNATPLKNPRNDAAAIGATLEKLGFEVVLGTDLNADALRNTVRQFTRKLDGADTALFFYAGHGLQVNGTNYIAPTDAVLNNAAELEFETLRLDLVLGPMEQQARTSIVFLDACRDNPLVQNLARSMGTRSSALGRGLARVETGVGTFVGFATQPGNVALDGEGANSPFTTALLHHIEEPGLDIEMLMRRVREDVLATTRGKQVPWSNSSLLGKGFSFAAPQPAQSIEAGKDKEPQPTDMTIEVSWWDMIKNSDDPALLAAYLKKYPTGQFAELAKVMLDKSKGEQVALREGADARPKPDVEAPPAPTEPIVVDEPKADEPKADEPKEERTKTAAVEPSAPEETKQSREAAMWSRIRSSSDIGDFRTYLRRFPRGAFAKQARQRIAQLTVQNRSIRTRAKPEPPPARARPVAQQSRRPERPVRRSLPDNSRTACGDCIPSYSVIRVCGPTYLSLRAKGKCD